MLLRRSRPDIFFSGALVLFFSAAGFAQSGVHAQNRQRSLRQGAPQNCQLQPGGQSTVLAVAGPQTLRLADGRFVRLTEILVPAPALAGFDPSSAASAYLRNIAVGRKVEVKFGGTQRDRYGVYAAHVYVASDPPVWLQEGLVSSGFAEVYPQADNHACAQQLLPSEAAARNDKRGHWGLAYFKVLQARDPRSILNLVQTYQIVEGTADRASESGGRITLHFGAANKFEFTAIVEPAAKKRFADKKSPEDWTGLALRLRGWVDRKRGPLLSIAQAEQIEFLTEAPPVPVSEAKEAR
ncbi:MAG: thermonuclease family protein [Rhodomicrobium sp.]